MHIVEVCVGEYVSSQTHVADIVTQGWVWEEARVMPGRVWER